MIRNYTVQFSVIISSVIVGRDPISAGNVPVCQKGQQVIIVVQFPAAIATVIVIIIIIVTLFIIVFVIYHIYNLSEVKHDD